MRDQQQTETNDDKTEALIISAPELSNSTSCCRKVDISFVVVVVVLCVSAKNLGVTFDMHLTMAAHVVNLIRPANFELHPISSVRHCLSLQATKPLDSAFVLSLHDCTTVIPSSLSTF